MNNLSLKNLGVVWLVIALLGCDMLTACTTAVISGRVTRDGRPILWKNRDFATAPRNEVVLLKSGKYRAVAIANAGSKSSVWMGTNEAGLCIENSLSRDLDDGSSNKGPGNGTFMKMVLESCATVEDVIELLDKTNKSGRKTTANMGIIDAKGGACVLEVGPSSYHLFDVNDPDVAPNGYLVRSNFSTVAQQLDPEPEIEACLSIASGDRYAQGCRLLESQVGDLSLAFLLQQVTRDLSDADGMALTTAAGELPSQLPQYVDTADTISRSTTVSAAVFHGVKPGEDPRLTTMWAILGDPKFSIAVPCFATMQSVGDPVEGSKGGEIGEIARTLRDYSLTQNRDKISTVLLPGIWTDISPIEHRLILETIEARDGWLQKSVGDQQLTQWHQQCADTAFQALHRELKEAKQLALEQHEPGPINLKHSKPQTSEVVRVAVYDHSDGSANGPKNLAKFLTAENGFEFQRVSPKQIQEGVLSEFDVLIMPGGSGSKQSAKLEVSGRQQIQQFVHQGGGYVGICAGSYLASSHYSWSLDLINTRVWDRAHWARGTGKVKVALTDSGQSLLESDTEKAEVYYGQGPLLIPGSDPNLPGYHVLATFESEVVSNGAISGAMEKTHAIVCSKYGEGRVICYSPHPETATGPNQLIKAGVRWAAASGKASSQEK